MKSVKRFTASPCTHRGELFVRVSSLVAAIIRGNAVGLIASRPSDCLQIGGIIIPPILISMMNVESLGNLAKIFLIDDFVFGIVLTIGPAKFVSGHATGSGSAFFNLEKTDL